MADTKIIDQFKLSGVDQWEQFVKEIQIADRLSWGDPSVTADERSLVEGLADKITAVFPQLADKTAQPNFIGVALKLATDNLQKAIEQNVNIPPEIKQMRERFEKAHSGDATSNKPKAREKLQQQFRDFNKGVVRRGVENAKQANELPVAEVAEEPTVEIPTPEPVSASTVSRRVADTPSSKKTAEPTEEKKLTHSVIDEEGNISAQPGTYQSDQKKQEAAAAARREDAIKRKQERYFGEDPTILQAPERYALGGLKGILKQVTRTYKPEEAQTPWGKALGALGVGAAKPAEKTETTKTRSEKHQRQVAAVAAAGSIITARTIWDSVLDNFSGVKERFVNAITGQETEVSRKERYQAGSSEKASSLAVQRAQRMGRTIRQDQQGPSQKAPGGGAVASQAVRGGGGGFFAPPPAQNVVSLKLKGGRVITLNADTFFALLNSLSNSMMGLSQSFGSIPAMAQKSALVLFLVLMATMSTLTVFTVTLVFLPAYFNPIITGVAADFKDDSPTIPTIVNKTVDRIFVNNSDVGNKDLKINYSVTVENRPDANESYVDVTEVYDHGSRIAKMGRSYSGGGTRGGFDYTIPAGTTNKTIINTYTAIFTDKNTGAEILRLSASAVTYVGDVDYAGLACPIIATTRRVSLGPGTATGGHCGPGYPAMEFCEGPSAYAGNDTAIDVVAGNSMVGELVYLPVMLGKVNGQMTYQKLTWTQVSIARDSQYRFTTPDGRTVTQQFPIYQTTGFDKNGKKVDFKIEMHHLFDVTVANPNQQFKSGDVIGRLAGFDGNVSSPHTHIQIAVRPAGSGTPFMYEDADKYLGDCANKWTP